MNTSGVSGRVSQYLQLKIDDSNERPTAIDGGTDDRELAVAISGRRVVSCAPTNCSRK